MLKEEDNQPRTFAQIAPGVSLDYPADYNYIEEEDEFFLVPPSILFLFRSCGS
jgi:hypothetical protein